MQPHFSRWSNLISCVQLYTFLIVCLFFSSPSTSEARLGETEVALEKRFGEPLASIPKDNHLSKSNQDRISVKIYNIGPTKNGPLLEVTFFDGLSRQEFYFQETEKSKRSNPWNENQINYILEVNSEGSNWNYPTQDRESAVWGRKDLLATASRKEVKPRINLVESLPIRSGLVAWTGIEITSAVLRDFLKQAEEDHKMAKKLQETELNKKNQQEQIDRAALPGI